MARLSSMIVLTSLALLGSACGLFGDGNPYRELREPPTLPWPGGLPLLPEDKPRSIRYRQAMLHWRTGTVAFALTQYVEAANRFLEVARELKAEQPHPHASTFAVARCLAYENAGCALSTLKDRTGARDRLSQAVAEDAACPQAVRRAFSQLPEEP